MKYANYKFYARGVNNLGDNMQLIAIDYIYEQMGIPKEDIVYIDKNELSTYKGEYVILPVTMPLIDFIEGGISGRFSERIIPVFIGLTMAVDTLLPEEVEYYRRFEPIGCRDERTMNTLRSCGISAYLHGCITAILPKRHSQGNRQGKVFIVDAPPELIEFIPYELQKDAVFLTHMHPDMEDDPKDKMSEYYNRYKNEAKLVITSLLHCSVPCMAAGIPVVLAKTKISYRFGWLEKLLPVYNCDEFDNIDWNPNPVEYEEHKAKLFKITVERLQSVYNKHHTIYDLSYFYESREKKEYINDAFDSIKQYIDRKFTDKDAVYEYSVWGLTQMSTQTVQYISKICPKASLMHVYDSYRKVQFEGKLSESPELIRNYPDEIVFVTTNGAKKMALKMFDEIGKEKDSYVFFEPIK